MKSSLPFVTGASYGALGFLNCHNGFSQLIRNRPVELLPPVDSMEGLWQDWEQATVESKLSAAIVGSEATMKSGMERLVEDTGADELIVVPIPTIPLTGCSPMSA